MDSIVAEVDYRHPNLTIVAQDEPLDSVLKSVSKEMRIFLTTPTAPNPVVNCDIRNQPIKRAFKELLGDMSYSLEWKDDGEQLVGLTILAGSQEVGGAIASTSSGSKSTTPTFDQTAPPGGENRGNQGSGKPVGQGNDAAAMATHDRDVEMETERRKQEARMEEERARREAEMVLRREQEVIAHEARMKAEVIRSEAQMAEYVESQGLSRGP